MTSETKTTLTFLAAGLMAAVMVLGADTTFTEILKPLFR